MDLITTLQGCYHRLRSLSWLCNPETVFWSSSVAVSQNVQASSFAPPAFGCAYPECRLPLRMINGISPLEFLPLFLLSLNAFQKYYSYLSRSVSCKNSYPLPFPLGSVGSKSSLLSLHLSSTPCLTAGLFVISQPNCV